MDCGALAPRIAVHGTSAIVAAHNLVGNRAAYTAFCSLPDEDDDDNDNDDNDGGGWMRRKFFAFDKRPREGPGYEASIFGATVAVGFRQADAEAGGNSGRVQL